VRFTRRPPFTLLAEMAQGHSAAERTRSNEKCHDRTGIRTPQINGYTRKSSQACKFNLIAVSSNELRSLTAARFKKQASGCTSSNSLVRHISTHTISRGNQY
jgi:hypothetical protein